MLTFVRPGRWFGPLDGNNDFSAADFDPLIGHSVAVTDAAASVFAAELIAAYPEAKVVLNYRRDLDAWSVFSEDSCYESGARAHGASVTYHVLPLWSLAEVEDLLKLFQAPERDDDARSQ